MSSLEKIRDQFRKILQLPSSKSLSMAGKEVETAFLTYMRRACDTFDLTKNIEVNLLNYSFDSRDSMLKFDFTFITWYLFEKNSWNQFHEKFREIDFTKF